MMTALRKLLAHLRPPAPRPPPLPPPGVEISERGMRELRTPGPREFAWEELISVKIVWSENPWGDPFCGSYCDTEWWIKSSSGQSISFWDEDQNRQVMLPAFEKYLPGFSFDYPAFDQIHKGRTFELDGGEYLVWNRT